MTIPAKNNARFGQRQNRRPAHFASMAAFFAALLLPAFWNGFPFLFTDSGTYLLSAVRVSLPDDRPVFYSIFLLLTHLSISPWLSIVAQSLIVAVMVQIAMRRIFCFEQASLLGTCGLVIVAVFQVGWFSGQLMPDIFTGVMVLGLLLITVSWTEMNLAERCFVLATVSASASFHLAHTLIAAASVPLAFVWLFRRRQREWLPSLVALLAVIAVAPAAIVSLNLIAKRGPVFSSSSSTFLLAKLLEDDAAVQAIESRCPSVPALCSELPALKDFHASAQYPTRAEHFLWSGLRDRASQKGNLETEARQLNRVILDDHWRHYLLRWASDTWRQFLSVRIGDQLAPVPEGYAAQKALSEIFGPSELPKYRASLQANGKLPLNEVNLASYALDAVSAVVLIAMIFLPGLAGARPSFAALFVVVFLFWNAAVMGSLSAVNDRYQSRMMWLPTVVALLGLVRVFARPPHGVVPTRQAGDARKRGDGAEE
jgi:hypothetical protein